MLDVNERAGNTQSAHEHVHRIGHNIGTLALHRIGRSAAGGQAYGPIGHLNAINGNGRADLSCLGELGGDAADVGSGDTALLFGPLRCAVSYSGLDLLEGGFHGCTVNGVGAFQGDGFEFGIVVLCHVVCGIPHHRLASFGVAVVVLVLLDEVGQVRAITQVRFVIHIYFV